MSGGRRLLLCKRPESRIAFAAIGHVDLQERPLFFRDFTGVVERTQSNELVMELSVHSGSHTLGLFRTNSLTQTRFWGKTQERSRSRPR